MVLAAFNDNLYKALFLGHILSLLIAFAPAVVHPVMSARAKGDGEDVLVRLGGYMAANGRAIHFPALALVGLFGLGMVFASDSVWDFDQIWLGIALLNWLVICGLILGLMLPSEGRLARGDLAAEKPIALCGQIVTLLTLAMLYLMIWKPGA